MSDEESAETDGLLASSTVLDETAALPADLGQGGFDVLPENQHLHDTRGHTSRSTAHPTSQ
jgi:hypothetical protein